MELARATFDQGMRSNSIQFWLCDDSSVLSVFSESSVLSVLSRSSVLSGIGVSSIGLGKLFFFPCLLFFWIILKNSAHYSHLVEPLFSC